MLDSVIESLYYILPICFCGETNLSTIGRIKMSKILKKINRHLKAFDGSSMPKDAIKESFQRSTYPCYSLPDDYENELKFCSTKSVSEVQKEIAKLFSTQSRHDSDIDGFFVIPNSAEENNYYLTSVGVDTVTFDTQKGIITKYNEFDNADHQMRVRLAFHPHIVEALAKKQKVKPADLEVKNPMAKFGATQVYGDPEVSVKTSLEKSENQERGEYEVFLGKNNTDYTGTILKEKGHALEPAFKNTLQVAHDDPNTDVYVEEICMTRRVMFYGLHYVAEHNAYVGYECTFDNNKFADVHLNTADKYSDREMEFEAHSIYPADGRVLSAEEQKEILDASTESLKEYVLNNTTSFKESWGSKLERARAAAREIRNSLMGIFNKAGQKTQPAGIHPCLPERRSANELLESSVTKLYELSLTIEAPVCETNSAEWVKNRRIRKQFEPEK